ncbi:MAG: fatty acid oxidation complex subunit alpha FadJ [Acidimicrobiia bacterium]|nr:fatty acid oxidation complex subunit alpha FadJ [Acidimicrobiia bacterium]
MDLKNHTLTIDDGVALLTMNRHDESMNTLGEEFVRELDEVVERLGEDDVHAVVIASAKNDFLAGADITMFGELTTVDAAAEAVTALHGTYGRLEDLHTQHGKPVIAAIDGACLGGGLELALAASMRICSDSAHTQLGQPEVQIGLIPGAGGTQRLPRVVGIQEALTMIVTGRPVRPSKARRIGLVSEVVPPEVLVEVALLRAREAIGPVSAKGTHHRKPGLVERMRTAALEGNPAGRKLLFKKATERMLKETGGNYPAPQRAIDAIQIGIDHGFEAGAAAEIRFFAELVLTPESKALRSIFFAQQELKRDTGVDSDVRPIDVEHVAVLGGGLMGGGIAAVSTTKAGANVRIKEIDNAGVARGLAYVDRVVRRRAKRSRMSEFEVDQVLHRVTGTTEWNGFGNTDLVIEAVFEDLDLKQSIVKQVEDVVPETAVFASNTSTLPITRIAEASDRPDKVVGMHYFSPVEKMPLLEVVTTEKTSDETTATAVAFGKRQGKTVIVVNDGTGFYTSRVLGPYSNEAAFLLEEGASVEAIDGAMTAWGFPVGPLLLADEVGIDVGAHISEIFLGAFGERMRGPDMMAKLMADDRKGRKNGRGFYVYEDGERKGVDQTVYQALGLGDRKESDRTEIQERLSLAFLNEAARCLEEGILRSARDGDIGAVFGLGFPPFRGGPFWTIDQIGAANVVERLRGLEERFGSRFTPAQILIDHAESGTSLR